MFLKVAAISFRNLSARFPFEFRSRISHSSTQNVIYTATATTPSASPKTYIGLTEGPFKQRYSQHKLSFTHPKYKQSTTLSKFIWDSKTAGVTPEVSWSISKTVPAYNNITKRCLLCLTEKLSIISFENQTDLLNNRSELLSKCRHQNKFLLSNFHAKAKSRGTF